MNKETLMEKIALVLEEYYGGNLAKHNEDYGENWVTDMMEEISLKIEKLDK